jgi:hypothetical protein
MSTSTFLESINPSVHEVTMSFKGIPALINAKVTALIAAETAEPSDWRTSTNISTCDLGNCSINIAS